MIDSRVQYCPFRILIDTREQKPFQFRGLETNATKNHKPYLVETIKATLETGDYSIEDYETRIAVERKSKPDLFACMGRDRERFEEQIRRLNEMEHAFVVVEAGFDSIMRGCENSKLSGKTVFRTRISWEQKYPNVHWWWTPSVHFAEAVTFRIFETFWRHENGSL